MLEIDGFVRAQRFRMADLTPGVTAHDYAAIYELETEDPGAAMAALRGRLGVFTMSNEARS
ncbi:MAG: hypothetical protein ACKVHU_15620 [Acidimicrobiales bacterium]